MERRRHSLSVGITRGGKKYVPFVKGGLGVLPQENFLIQYVCKKRFLYILRQFCPVNPNLFYKHSAIFQIACDSFFETRPLMSVLTTISPPRWISSGGGIKLATGVVFLSCFVFVFFLFFCFFFGGGPVLYIQVSISYKPGQSVTR